MKSIYAKVSNSVKWLRLRREQHEATCGDDKEALVRCLSCAGFLLRYSLLLLLLLLCMCIADVVRNTPKKKLSIISPHNNIYFHLSVYLYLSTTCLLFLSSRIFRFAFLNEWAETSKVYCFYDNHIYTYIYAWRISLIYMWYLHVLHFVLKYFPFLLACLPACLPASFLLFLYWI